jgi:exodeoxyribonuclease VII large subunit
VVVANVQVQGMSAIEQNVAAITHFNQMAEPVDVLVVIRGGGSAEDLAVYNDEYLVRAIAGSRIPTLVGVGHEVDISLADLVADVRAATPSNAAQIVVPDRRELLAEVRVLKGAIDRTLALRLQNYKQTIMNAQRSYVRSLDISTIKLRLAQAVQRLSNRQDSLLERQKENVKAYHRTLRQLDPRAVLQRGYALVRLENGHVLSGQLPKKGDILRIEQANSIITSEVTDAKQKD